MKIVFMGTGEIALPTLQWLLNSEHEIVGLVTQPDRPVGRSGKPQAPAVKALALEAGVPVLQPERSKEILAELEDWQADLHIVMAFGQILPQAIYEMAPMGCINLHASLLPKYRGASCIQGPIANGDEKTGITVMHVVKQLDAGNMISMVETPVGIDETGGELHDRLAKIGPEALALALEQVAAGEGAGEVQDDTEMTYAPKLMREHGLVDWTQSAESLERLIRAYDPWPGTYTVLEGKDGKNRRMKIFPQAEVVEASGTAGEILAADDEGIVIACGVQALRLTIIQPEGKKRMNAADFVRGGGCDIGAVFSGS